MGSGQSSYHQPQQQTIIIRAPTQPQQQPRQINSHRVTTNHYPAMQQQPHYSAQYYPTSYYTPPQQQTQTQQAPASSTTTTTSASTIRCMGTVHHGSVRLAPSTQDLTFEVDSTSSGQPLHCCVYYAASVSYKNNKVVLNPQAGCPSPAHLPPFQVPRGMRVPVRVKLTTGHIPTKPFLEYSTTRPRHMPYVISLTAPEDTCVYFIFCDEVGRVLQEVLQTQSDVYELQQVFGAEVVDSTASSVASPVAGSVVTARTQPEEDEGRLCVVCLSEPKDTTILPCRHMCLCQGCAVEIQSHSPKLCPLCRSPIQQVLTFNR
eukprot:PhF_6_TR8452/c0_g1_i3/m.13185